MKVQFFGSQLEIKTGALPPYTGSPWQLLQHDIFLFFWWLPVLPWICYPIFPKHSNPLNELYIFNFWNDYCMILHFVLIIAQSAFLVSLPILIYLPITIYVAYLGGFLLLNYLICRIFLNGKIPPTGLPSTENETTRLWKKHDDETWIFLNGVSVGTSWLQSNIDRISRTFERPVIGVHNATSGIIFDVIQCLIQRCMLYATSDVRQCYLLVKEALYREGCHKVVFILHSQGAIEGSMIIDWLLNEVPQDLLQCLEVYTFGNAANHFNNPYTTSHASAAAGDNDQMNMKYNRAISHIEHYANSEDFVACWGVLSCIKHIPKDRFENRFMGRVFKRPGKGHLLNQHYLDYMFPLKKSGYGVRDSLPGDFMEMDCEMDHGKGQDDKREGTRQSLFATKGDRTNDLDVHVLNDSPVQTRINSWEAPKLQVKIEGKKVKVKDLSRLWLYRNGMSPPVSTEQF